MGLSSVEDCIIIDGVFCGMIPACDGRSDGRTVRQMDKIYDS